MLIVLAVGFFSYITSRSNKTKRRSVFADYAPTLLTSLGILGTFTGIVSGLLNFDIEHIDTSISTLLSGMKTAFLTSVIGVCFSIGLKIIYQLPSVEKFRPWIKSHISAVGLSFSKAVRNIEGKEDKDASKRVTFRIMTNAEEQLQKLSELK
ncbi:TPA: MotA/TolQ/ExbB proton channel family protein [Haemophilus influenzae]